MKRNQVIVTALVVMIAVAGYLNVMDSRRAAEGESDVIVYQQLSDGTLVPSEDLQEVSANDLDEELGSVASADDDISIFTEFDEIITGAKSESENEAGKAIFVNSSINGEYDKQFFVSAKLEREQTRAKEKDILTEMIGNSNLNKEDVSACASALLEIQKRIEKETAAEAMIEAKGFNEVYVRIDDSTVDVIVSKEALSESEIAQIEDIVTRKTGLAPDKIKISTLKAVG